MKTDLSQFDNRWYSPGASLPKRVLWWVVSALFFLNPLQLSSGLKVLLLRLFGARVGRGVVIKPGVQVKYPWHFEVGDHVWIGENVWIDNLVKVRLADHVCISQGAMLLTGNHNYKRSTFDLMTGEITLEQGAWIGAKSVVCPGVSVASHAILTVGSVATTNLAAYTIYQGNPAVAIRKRNIGV